MVQAARLATAHGTDAATVHDAGGVQAFVPAAVESEKAALSAGIEPPERAL